MKKVLLLFFVVMMVFLTGCFSDSESDEGKITITIKNKSESELAAIRWAPSSTDKGKQEIFSPYIQNGRELVQSYNEGDMPHTNYNVNIYVPDEGSSTASSYAYWSNIPYAGGDIIITVNFHSDKQSELYLVDSDKTFTTSTGSHIWGN